MADAIKIAFDFISFYNLRRTWKLVHELRTHRLLTGLGDDVLQLNLTLYHAWKALSIQFEVLTATMPAVPRPFPVSYPAATTPAFPVKSERKVTDVRVTVTSDQEARHKRRTEKKRAAALRKATVAKAIVSPGTFSCPMKSCQRNNLNRSGMINHL